MKKSPLLLLLQVRSDRVTNSITIPRLYIFHSTKTCIHLLLSTTRPSTIIIMASNAPSASELERQLRDATAQRVKAEKELYRWQTLEEQFRKDVEAAKVQQARRALLKQSQASLQSMALQKAADRKTLGHEAPYTIVSRR